MIRIAYSVIALAGLLVVLAAVFGRFHGAATISVMGHLHTASSFLLVGNTLLLTSILLAVLDQNKPQKPEQK